MSEDYKISSLKNYIDSIRQRQLDVDAKASEIEEVIKVAGKTDGHTRNRLTLFFIGGFFGILIFCCLFVLVYNWAAMSWAINLSKNGFNIDKIEVPFLELDKLLSIMIGAFGTSLGFIIGYYFKEKNK